MGKQIRRVAGVTYLDEETLLALFEQKKNQIRNFAFIVHDKDIYTEDIPTRGIVAGELKEKHIHFILLLKYGYPLSTLQNWFKGFYDIEKDEPINTKRLEPISNLTSAFRYLTHIDNPEKFQYNACDVHALDFEEFVADDLNCEDNTLQAVEMLLDGNSVKDCVKRFGRDFIIHFRSIREVVDAINYEENKMKEY